MSGEILEVLDEMEIKRLCKKYNYKYRYFYETAIIETGVDMWRITLTGIKYKKIMVEHINKNGNKKRKIQFHKQRVAYDLDWIFKNIISPHQDFLNVFNETFKIKKLLTQVDK